ncbi:uncharacterized protein BKA55DRAFT_682101 [Fusarium redolens]|uniref:Uncharacterized protein n=1 Tax=Fusarium redolens TaxID=48865 RepID=A0A9P9KUV3_FUSRE|nr:uncharacterized protein BKA55DRAFT_682101 [Fusarium redolens]KAH7269008.1 hypothetical protein BKA55DRAFT_682101 [Fusarium redolens]
MSLPVFLVEYLGLPRNHHALFIRLNEETEDGELYHIAGNKPQEPNSYVAQHYLGFISSSDRQFFKQICQSNPPPAKQFNGNKKINPRQPLRRCQEWTAETIAMLQSHVVLMSEGSVGNSAPRGSTRPVDSAYGQSSKQSSQARSSSSNQPLDGQTSSDGYWTFSSKYGDYYHVGKDGRTLWASQQRAGSSGNRS